MSFCQYQRQTRLERLLPIKILIPSCSLILTTGYHMPSKCTSRQVSDEIKHAISVWFLILQLKYKLCCFYRTIKVWIVYCVSYSSHKPSILIWDIGMMWIFFVTLCSWQWFPFPTQTLCILWTNLYYVVSMVNSHPHCAFYHKSCVLFSHNICSTKSNLNFFSFLLYFSLGYGNFDIMW